MRQVQRQEIAHAGVLKRAETSDFGASAPDMVQKD
jgi:hypothetical protein